MCWHKWTKWEKFEKKFVYLAFKREKQYDGIELWQSRKCGKCGYYQEKQINTY